MQIAEYINQFTLYPFPLWENQLTEVLVKYKWNELRTYGLYNPEDYNTVRILKNISQPLLVNKTLINSYQEDDIHLEAPSFDNLQDFYDQHGLIPCSYDELEFNNAIPKLKNAMDMLKMVPPAYKCVFKLVRSIQVLEQEDDEIDTSYSHPKIPFSIFVSVCQDTSTISNLRVAESILHEAMHLKLTLIENVVQLVKGNTGNLFYSPWRNEERPTQGILHGLFVFRAIYEFYSYIINFYIDNVEIVKFLHYRLSDIHLEISKLNKFSEVQDLSEQGRKLVDKLMEF